MWEPVLDKLNTLMSLDRQCEAFGAYAHEYRLNDRVVANELEQEEAKLGCRLPDEVRDFYRNVGNGVAGPGLGLVTVQELYPYHPSKPYIGVDALKRHAADSGNPPDDRGYFEADSEVITGLIGIIHTGSGHYYCYVVSGEFTGRIVGVSCDGFVHETDDSLADLYHRWLDKEIELFQETRDLMRSGASYKQICDAMKEKYTDWNAKSRMSSIANARKPTSLFGDPRKGTRIFNSRGQDPWFEFVLKDWQSRNL
jgi:hypothetical protein